MKKENKTTKKQTLITETFLNKTGKKINVSSIISENDCWFLEREKRWVLTHSAIKKIAEEAGISKNYDVEESSTITPDIRNELEHIVRVTIHCKSKHAAGSKNEGCVHSDENYLTITGEANSKNTPSRGRGYLRKMAEKRAFDIAVLEHTGLYTATFSEEESEEFSKTKETSKHLTPGMPEFESIIEDVNKILDAKTKTDLTAVAKYIKKNIKDNKYTELQIDYLRELYSKEHAKKYKAF